ncbi:hypothetical protein M427DRAFT_147830 [Gonapodya prolifera JEL478]|uniref:Uncharacterized protein n=1 Tax=Gonapodya prolifera (strain JEL478) TaxID=1344416 RepID=A0A139A4S8_GONPJ|nr:hypothetical protein M427DRAFT_147830 [Gonapodya prolifera JEL478]|eukprot:KXS11495.1 hypothetical protein M427DRAFT_147830 [Gonapodya prolifera JEL478]
MPGGPRRRNNNNKALRSKKAAFRARSKAVEDRVARPDGAEKAEEEKPKIRVRAGRVTKAGVEVRPTELSKKKVKKLEQRKKLVTRHLQEIGVLKKSKSEDVEMGEAEKTAKARK